MLNYIGSKHRLLGFLTEGIANVTGDVSGAEFSDIFAGTSTVGRRFRELGAIVTSNDLQHYSYIISKHLIENQDEELNSSFFSLLEGESKEGFIYNNYCSPGDRKYFTDENGKVIDGVRLKLEELLANSRITMKEYYWGLASLLESADKVANTASVYGAFLKHYKKSARKLLTIAPLPIVTGPAGRVFNEDANSLISKISGDILYLDPPYNSRQYSSNYHLLETISQYDSPVPRGKTGLRPVTENKSDYSSKRSAGKALNDLLKNADFKYTFISYNNEGILSLNEIKEISEKYGKYDLLKTTHKRFRADTPEARNHKADTTTEFLHILRK